MGPEPKASGSTTKASQSTCPRRVGTFATPPTGAHSVLYLILDDWSHVPLALTPHLNKLAASGLTFDSVYAQAAHCVPSRNSFLSGRSPETTRVLGAVDHSQALHDGTGRDPHSTYASKTRCGASWTSLPEHFHTQGWRVFGAGKIFHGGQTNSEMALRYSPKQARSYLKHDYGACPRDVSTDCRIADSQRPDNGAVDFCVVDDDIKLFDDVLAERTIHQLDQAVWMQRSDGRPFMVMAGFVRPHAPWTVPRRKWLELNKHDALDACSLYETTFSATNAAYIGCQRNPKSWLVPEPSTNNTCSYAEKDLLAGLECGSPIDISVRTDARRAYFASVAFVDEQAGRVLSHLEVLNQTEQTLVVVHSDHGFHLGENGLWTKETNYELATRAPLIARAPWLPRGGSGERVTLLVELLDLYPTMATLAGAPQPAGPAEVEWPLEGKDVSAVFTKQIPLQQSTEGFEAAFSQFFRCNAPAGRCEPPTPWTKFYGMPGHGWRCLCTCSEEKDAANGPLFMGYAVRTFQFRYVAWMRWSNGSALWGTPPVAEELYMYDFQSGMQSGRRALHHPAARRALQTANTTTAYGTILGGPSGEEWQELERWATLCPRVYEAKDLSRSPTYAKTKQILLERVRTRFEPLALHFASLPKVFSPES